MVEIVDLSQCKHPQYSFVFTDARRKSSLNFCNFMFGLRQISYIIHKVPNIYHLQMCALFILMSYLHFILETKTKARDSMFMRKLRRTQDPVCIFSPPNF